MVLYSFEGGLVMLSVLINDKSENVIPMLKQYESYVSDYFDNEYEDEWFKDSYVKKLIKAVDSTEVYEDGTLYNEVLGEIVKSQLSSGVKGLILLYKTDCKINGDRLGDNCWRYVLEIAQIKDVNIVLRHIPELSSDFKAILINNDKIINRSEYIFEFVRLIG